MFKRYRRSVSALILSAALGAASPVQAAPLLTNGDFEGGGLGGWSSTGTVNTAPYSAYAGIGMGGLNPGLYGTTFASFNAGNSQPNGVLQQIINTVAGQTYTMTFTFGNFNTNVGANTQAVTASAINQGDSLVLGSLLAIDSVLGRQTNLNNVYGGANPYSFNFVAASTQTIIQFADSSQSSSTESADGILDNVFVVPAVPELNADGAAPVVSIALLGFLMLTDRRRRLV